MQQRVLGITPIIAVRDIRVAIDFYVRHLKAAELFATDDGTYGAVRFQEDEIHFQLAADAEVLAATAMTMQFRLRVSDVDALWEHVLATDPRTKRRPPQDEPWGLREFHLLDPDGALVIVSTVTCDVSAGAS